MSTWVPPLVADANWSRQESSFNETDKGTLACRTRPSFSSNCYRSICSSKFAGPVHAIQLIVVSVVGIWVTHWFVLVNKFRSFKFYLFFSSLIFFYSVLLFCTATPHSSTMIRSSILIFIFLFMSVTILGVRREQKL